MAAKFYVHKKWSRFGVFGSTKEATIDMGYTTNMTADQASQQWLNGAMRALLAAEHMRKSGDCEFALFTCHLAVEKALKGLFVRTHDTRAPKTHNLEELAQECGLTLSEEERLELREFTSFSEFGRYGDETWLQADANPENTDLWLQRARYFLSLCTNEK